MIIRLAEGPLQTKFGTFSQILYYDGQKETIALVMAMWLTRKMFCAASIPTASLPMFLTASNATAASRWKWRSA
jgi:hypothetical protein